MGAVIGSLFSGIMSDNYGRKPVIIITDLLFILGSIFMGYSENVAEIMVGRFTVGIAIGMASQVVGVYLSEVTPNSVRGFMVSFSNVMIIMGQFIAVIFAYLVQPNWRLMMGFPGIIALFQLVLVFFLPESPKYLFKLHY